MQNNEGIHHFFMLLNCVVRDYCLLVLFSDICGHALFRGNVVLLQNLLQEKGSKYNDILFLFSFLGCTAPCKKGYTKFAIWLAP